MRHYLWYDATGEIRGRSKNINGFSGDPLDSGTSDPEALDIRDYMLNKLGFGIVDGIAYDCSCIIGTEDCEHDAEALVGNYVSGGNLTQKLSAVLKLDGAVTPSSQDPVDLTPGAVVSFTVEAAVPDSHTLTLLEEGVALSQTTPVLTFTGGVSNSVQLTIPPQGMSGKLGGADKLLGLFVINLRGWA